MKWFSKKTPTMHADRGDPADEHPDGIAEQFQNAWVAADEQDADPELMPVRLARACVAVLPVSGAAISLLYDDFRVPLGASDDAATCAERLQFTTGQGPCLDAVRSGDTVLAGPAEILDSWPEYGQELLRPDPVRRGDLDATGDHHGRPRRARSLLHRPADDEPGQPGRRHRCPVPDRRGLPVGTGDERRRGQPVRAARTGLAARTVGAGSQPRLDSDGHGDDPVRAGWPPTRWRCCARMPMAPEPRSTSWPRT